MITVLLLTCAFAKPSRDPHRNSGTSRLQGPLRSLLTNQSWLTLTSIIATNQTLCYLLG
jgi:hypothetical protein